MRRRWLFLLPFACLFRRARAQEAGPSIEVTGEHLVRIDRDGIWVDGQSLCAIPDWLKQA